MKQELAALLQWMRDWLRRGQAEGRADHVMRLLVAAVVLLFPAACILVDRGDSLSLVLLLVIGLTAWVRNGFRAGLTRREWLCVGAFVFFFAAGVMAFEAGHQTDSGFRLLGRYLRLLFVLPAFMALKRHRPPALLVWAGLGLGALALGVDAIWERTASSGFLRPNGDLNLAILFGDLVTLTTFAFAAGYIYIDARLPRLGPKLVGLCVTAGVLACLLSGTRGAWLALPVLLVLFLTVGHLLRPRTVLAAAAVLLLLFTVAWFLPQSHMRERIQGGVAESQAYFHLQPAIQALGPPPVCMDDPTLLQAWLDSGMQEPAASLEAEVAEEEHGTRESLAKFGCRHFAAIHLTNHGSREARLRLPRIQRPGRSLAHASWLVSGRGALRFGGRRTHVHHFRQRSRYQRLDMSTGHHFGDGVTVIVPPHSRVRLVPVETQYGEYRYAPLQHSSISERLEMWAVAWDMFRQHPLTGVGTGAYMAEAGERVRADTEPPVTAAYDHPHSEYLDALSSRGLLGLLAVLLLLGVPAWLFSRGLGSPDPARAGACLAGLLVTVGFAIFGLTETMFIHSVTLGWYAIMTAVFMVTAERPDGQGN